MKTYKIYLIGVLPMLFSCQFHQGPAFEEGMMRSGVDVEISSLEEEVNYGDLSSLGYVGTYTETSETDTFAIEVAQGYFINPNLEVGGEFLYSNKDAQITARDAGTVIGTGGVDDTRLGISGYARYYFVPEGSTRFFGEAQLGWLDGSRDFAGSTSFDFDGFLFGLSAGAIAFVTESSAVEAQIAFRSATLDGTDSTGLPFDIDATEVALLVGYTYFF